MRLVLQSEQEHRRVKVYYARTNKNKFTRQCTRLELRERVLRSIRAKEKGHNEQMEPDRNDSTKDTRLSFEQADPLPQTSPQDHTQISRSMRHRVDLRQFVTERRNDPAFRVSPTISLSQTWHPTTPFRTSFLASRPTF